MEQGAGLQFPEQVLLTHLASKVVNHLAKAISQARLNVIVLVEHQVVYSPHSWSKEEEKWGE